MSPLVVFGVLAGFLFLSAVFSGSETGVYSLSRVRLDADARAGSRSARLLVRLLGNETGFLIALLIGNNLMLELLTHGVEEELVSGLPPGTRELVVTLLLTPVVFLFGELLPKDMFRRRPNRFLAFSSPVLATARTLFLPLSVPIHLVARGLERLFGLRHRDVTRTFGRQEMLEVVEESARSGALAPEARELVHNVLVLRETPVQRVMVPWDRVRTVDLAGGDAEARRVTEDADFTRLPVLDGRGEERRVLGYVHQLDVLGQERQVRHSLRELPRIAPGTPVDRALTRLRTSGQRLALVGTPEVPEGLVTLMDLLEAISRESRAER